MDYYSLIHNPCYLIDLVIYATLLLFDFLPNGKCNFRRRFLNSPSMLDESVEMLSSPPPFGDVGVVVVVFVVDIVVAPTMDIPLLLSCCRCFCCCCWTVVETMDDDVDSTDSKSVL